MQANRKELDNILQGFSLERRDEFVDKLNDLIQTEAYEILLTILSDFPIENRRLINTQSLSLIFKYLKLRQDNPLIEFEMFSGEYLTPLNNSVEFFSYIVDKARFLASMDALRFGLCPNLFDKVYQNLAPPCLGNREIVGFLKRVSKDTVTSVIQVLNFYALHLNDDEISNLALTLTNEKIRSEKEILDKLIFMNIEPTFPLESWDFLKNFSSKWFQNSKNFLKLKTSLDAKLFSPHGLDRILKHLQPNDLNEKRILILNKMVALFVSKAEAESAWGDLETCFSFETNEPNTIFNKLSIITSAFEAGDEHPEHALVLVKFLLDEGKNLNIKNFSDLIKLLYKFNSRLYTREGFNLYRRIETLGYPMGDDYIDALNGILQKRQLEYLRDLNHLSDAWLTLDGLTKLSRLNEGYLSPQNLQFLSRIDPSKLSFEDIDAINKVEQGELLKHYPSLQHVPIRAEELVSYVKSLQAIQKSVLALRKDMELALSESVLTTNIATDSLEDSAIPNKNADLTHKFLNDEEPYLLARYISDSLEDDPILLIQDRTSPLTLNEINQVFCVIRASSEDLGNGVIYARENAFALIGKRYPVLDCPLNMAHIFDITKDNLNVALINAKFRLSSKEGKSESTDKLERFAFIEQLQTKSYVNDIPKALLNEICLRQLDLRYFENKLLLAFLRRFVKKVPNEEELAELNKVLSTLLEKLTRLSMETLDVLPDSFFNKGITSLHGFNAMCDEDLQFLTEVSKLPHYAEIPKTFIRNFSLLKDLDRRYFQNPGMLAYLKRVLHYQITTEDVKALNDVAEVLFNKFSKHVNIVSILQGLPPKYFDNKLFTPDVFSSIPEEWLNAPFPKFLEIWVKNITPQHFKEGKIMSTESIEITISNFNQLAKDQKRFSVCKPIDFLDHLTKNLQDPRFNDLLAAAFGLLLTQPNDDQIAINTISKSLKDDSLNDVCVQLYLYATTHPNENFPQEIYQVLRERTKEILSSEDDFQSLQVFKSGALDIVRNFGIQLGEYQTDRQLTDEGEQKKSYRLFTKTERIVAFKALKKALKNESNAFPQLLFTIRDNQDNIGYNDFKVPLISSDRLESICKKFMSDARPYREQVLTIKNECDTENKLKNALLEDYFFELLFPNQILELAKLFPKAFFQIMEAYRPIELENIKLAEPRELVSSDADSITRLHGIYSASQNKQKEESQSLGSTSSFVLAPIPESKLTARKSTLDFLSPVQLESVPTSVTRRNVSTPPKMTTKDLMANLQTNSSRSKGSTSQPQQNGHPQISMRKTPLRRLEVNEREYQLNDTDLSVGLYQLRALLIRKDKEQQAVKQEIEEKSHVTEEDTQASKPPVTRIQFLQVGNLTENSAIDKASSVELLQTAMTNYPEKICFGIMNINLNHFVSVFLYQPAKGRPQLFIIDPSFNTPEKTAEVRKLVDRLQKKYRNWEIVSYEITQQFNDSDCGVCCLQMGEDLILKDLFTIESGRMVPHIENLTLNGDLYRGEEEKFLKKVKGVRIAVEERLGQAKTNYIMNIDGSADVDAGPYYFKNNKQLQKLILLCNGLIDTISKEFLSTQGQTIEILVSELKGQIPGPDSEVARFIQEYVMKSKLGPVYKQHVKEIEVLTKSAQAEVVNLKETSIEERLLRLIQIDYRKQRCALFNPGFVKFLKEKQIIKPGQKSEVPKDSDLYELYKEFVKENGDAEWIHFFEGSDWKHFEDVVLKHVKNVITQNNRFSHTHSNKETSNLASLGSLGQSYKLFNTATTQTQVRKSSSPYDRAATTIATQPKLDKGPTVVPSQQNFFTFLSRQPTSALPHEKIVRSAQQPFVDRLTQDLANQTKSESPVPNIAPTGVSGTRDTLRSLIQSLDNYPRPTRTFSVFSAFSSKPTDLVDTLKSDCARWEKWFDTQHDDQDILKQRYYIGTKLYGEIHRATSSKTFKWDEISPAKLILPYLAKILEISEDIIQKYNTHDNVDGLSSGTNELETKPGYAHLLQETLNKISSIQIDNKFEPLDMTDLTLEKNRHVVEI